jgi:DNA-binding MarR family transcriptional regulator
MLYEGFARAGFQDVRPAYGSILLALFEDEGLQMGELAGRTRLSKQTLTTLIRDMRDKGLVRRIRDAEDGRAYRIYLSARARKFRGVADDVLADLDHRVEEALSPGGAESLRHSLNTLIHLGRTDRSLGSADH